MIYAKTGMDRMPESCAVCDFAAYGCGLHSVMNFPSGTCPLTEIDDEQILAEQDDRLGNGG